MDAALAALLRDGRKKPWIDLTVKERAEEIEFEGCPEGTAHQLRALVWHQVLELIEDKVVRV